MSFYSRPGRSRAVQPRASRLDRAKPGRRFAVTGWVRNERDGSVLCIAEGEQGELDRFVEAIQRAKKANIDDTLIDDSPATGEFSGFNIRY